MIYKMDIVKISEFLEEVFKKWPEVTISMAHSDLDKKLETHLSIVDILKKINLEENLQLSLYLKEMKGELFLERIDLDPLKFSKGKFRYQLHGWGLIFINFQKKDMHFEVSSFMNSEKRAKNWSPLYPMLKSPDFWDWKTVKNTHRALEKILKNMSKI